LVLESQPRWLRTFHLFELDQTKVKQLEQLRASLPPRNKEKNEPKRAVNIYPGDFNTNIVTFLNNHPLPDKEATFCLLDQRTFECDWSSIEAVAQHKKGGHKIELFYFFPEGWLNRSVAGLSDPDARVLRWWGGADWKQMVARTGALRAQYVCERIKKEFNYTHVYPFPIYERKEKSGKVMYYMIHATDHPEAPKLMWRAYGKALDPKESGAQLELLRRSLGCI